jgi:RNA polymerase sigma-54 factor
MFEMSMIPDMGMRVTPALLQQAQLLTMPSLELNQAIQIELNENPALEEIETQDFPCDRCGGPVLDGLCLRCALSATEDDSRTAPQTDEQIDPLLFVAAPQSLIESLLQDLYASLPEHDHPIALALVGNLDDHGFLVDEPADLAMQLRVDEAHVVAILQRLRELGPPGIATRDTRECMLAQIDVLASQGVNCPHARTIVADYLEDFGSRRFTYIARQLHISTEEIEALRIFVRTHLWPFPSQAIQSETAPSQRTRYRTADIAITANDDHFSVEVLHSSRRLLRLNPLYQDLARNAATLDEGERQHVQEYINRARVFLAGLLQRESVLERIGKVIIERQDAFLRYGVRHLVPLTRAEIAATLGLHESTISRTTAEKTVLLPNKQLLPMSEFFVAARGVQDVLRELITNEQAPLSDEELANQLRSRGYQIARRTVAKYRDVMHIPPSHQR